MIVRPRKSEYAHNLRSSIDPALKLQVLFVWSSFKLIPVPLPFPNKMLLQERILFTQHNRAFEALIVT